jgi:hypothetical protein
VDHDPPVTVVLWYLIGVALGVTLGFALWAGRPAAEVGRFQGSDRPDPFPLSGEGDDGQALMKPQLDEVHDADERHDEDSSR